MVIKGNASLKSTKVLNCESGNVAVESATITSTSDGGYAIKAEGGSVVTLTDANVTISGETREEGGKIVKI